MGVAVHCYRRKDVGGTREGDVRRKDGGNGEEGRRE